MAGSAGVCFTVDLTFIVCFSSIVVTQSKNFFAALDDSDNEGAPVVPVKKEQPAKKPVAKATVGDTSKPDSKYVQLCNTLTAFVLRGGTHVQCKHDMQISADILRMD